MLNILKYFKWHYDRIFNKKIDTGFIPYEPTGDDFQLGAVLGKAVLMPDGHGWTEYLVEGERQNRGTETFSCFPYDTEVLMEDFTTKRICEIKKGEYVISHLGKKQKVLKTMRRDFHDKLVYLGITGLPEPIVCTKEHPILTERGFIKVEDLITDDRVLTPLTDNLIKDLTIKEVEKNKDFLWFLGLYLAEGNLGQEVKPENSNPKLKVRGSGNGRGSITFSLSKDEIELANKIIKIGNELFDTKFTIYYKKDVFSIIVHGYNVNLRDLLEELGGKLCYYKKLNSRLMYLEPELQLEIVKGWLDGDGNLNKKEEKIIGVTTSKELANQIHRILLRNKIKNYFHKRDAYGIHREAYDIGICGLEINKLYNWNIKRKKTEKYSKAIDYFKTGYLSRKIINLEQIYDKSVRQVYNLEVEEDNSYIVNTVAVHNCVSQSANNVLEIQLKRIIALNEDKPLIAKLNELGYIRNGEVNFSDRFTAKLSGTTASGNNQKRVADSIRHNGLVPEYLWPHVEGWNNFYSQPSLEVIQAGRKFADAFDITYEWVSPADFFEALKYNVVQVSGWAWPTPNNGIYPRAETTPNHAFVLYEFQKDRTKEIFDTYWDYGKENDYTKTLAWNFNLGWGMLFSIKLKKKFNSELVKKLLADGKKWIMRTDSRGQIYGLDEEEGLVFLDSNKNEVNRRVPLFDEWVQFLAGTGKLLPVSEENYKNISGEV